MSNLTEEIIEQAILLRESRIPKSWNRIAYLLNCDEQILKEICEKRINKFRIVKVKLDRQKLKDAYDNIVLRGHYFIMYENYLNTLIDLAFDKQIDVNDIIENEMKSKLEELLEEEPSRLLKVTYNDIEIDLIIDEEADFYINHTYLIDLLQITNKGLQNFIDSISKKLIVDIDFFNFTSQGESIYWTKAGLLKILDNYKFIDKNTYNISVDIIDWIKSIKTIQSYYPNLDYILEILLSVDTYSIDYYDVILWIGINNFTDLKYEKQSFIDNFELDVDYEIDGNSIYLSLNCLKTYLNWLSTDRCMMILKDIKSLETKYTYMNNTNVSTTHIKNINQDWGKAHQILGFYIALMNNFKLSNDLVMYYMSIELKEQAHIDKVEKIFTHKIGFPDNYHCTLLEISLMLNFVQYFPFNSHKKYVNLLLKYLGWQVQNTVDNSYLPTELGLKEGDPILNIDDVTNSTYDNVVEYKWKASSVQSNWEKIKEEFLNYITFNSI